MRVSQQRAGGREEISEKEAMISNQLVGVCDPVLGVMS